VTLTAFMNKFELSNNNTVLPNTALQSHLLTFPVFLVWMSAHCYQGDCTPTSYCILGSN